MARYVLQSGNNRSLFNIKITRPLKTPGCSMNQICHVHGLKCYGDSPEYRALIRLLISSIDVSSENLRCVAPSLGPELLTVVLSAITGDRSANSATQGAQRHEIKTRKAYRGARAIERETAHTIAGP